MEYVRRAFTLIELLVVLMIIGILSSITVGVYTNSVRRARIASAFAEIQQISMAVEAYRLDTGEYPHSSTGDQMSPLLLNPALAGVGCGYMTLSLLHSLNGNAVNPLHTRWRGPYLDIDREQLGTLDGGPTAGRLPAELQLLDPWGLPYRYLRFDHYVAMDGTELPPTDPFVTTETFYNVSTYQIVSNGPDSLTNPAPNIGLFFDDVTNFTR